MWGLCGDRRVQGGDLRSSDTDLTLLHKFGVAEVLGQGEDSWVCGPSTATSACLVALSVDPVQLQLAV